MSLSNGLESLKIQLTIEPMRKKALTADEIALRRSETARRRKNQSEQRLEEEKIETINRLLKPQAPRRRGQRANESPGPSESEIMPREATPPPPATKVRTVLNEKGTVVAIPERWIDVFFSQREPKRRPLEECGECGGESIYPGRGQTAWSVGCRKALKATGECRYHQRSR